MKVNFHISEKPCPACKHMHFIQFYQAGRTVSVSNNEVLVFKQNLECCDHCGLVRQEDNDSYTDEHLNKYYSQTFRTPVQPGILDKKDKRVQNAKKRLKFISKFKSRGRLLEIGFGDGVFLQMAADKFTCTGLDPSAGYGYLHDFLTKKGIEVSDKALESYSSKNKFDIVCAFLVLEHIKDPIAFIKKQIRHLSPKGVLVIEVPDVRRYRDFNSESVLTYEHVFHYCTESLSFLLSQLDLELIAADSKDISYGFSLIAAFKLVKKAKSKSTVRGFTIMNLFQGFLDRREQYRKKMGAAIGGILQEAHDKKQTVAVYGAGFLFNYAMECCGSDLSEIDFLFDDTRDKIGSIVAGKEIRPLADITASRPDVVMIFSEMFFEPMKKNVLNSTTHENIHFVNIHQLSV